LEKMCRSIFENTGTAMLVVDEDTTISMVNSELERITGYSKMELEGKRSWTEFVPKDHLERMREYHRLRRIDPKAAPRNYESQIIDKQSNVRDVLLTVSIIPRTKKSTVSFTDITEQRQMNQKLQESEEKYRVLVEGSLQGLVIIQDFHVVFANDAVAELIGRTVEEILAFSPDEVKAFVHPDDRELVWKRFSDRLEGKAVPTRYELRIMDKDGLIHWVEAFPRPIEYHGKHALQVAFVDITERKKAEDEIKRLAKFPEENPNPVMRLSQDGVVLDANKASGRLLQDWGCEVGGRAPKYWRDLVNELYASQSSRSVDVELGDQTLLFTLVPVKDSGYVNLYGRDVTKRKQAEEALRESEEKYRAIVENSPNLIGILQDGALKYVNKAMCERLGWTFEEMTSPSFKSVQRMIPSRLEEHIKQIIANRLRGETVPPYETNLLTRDHLEITVMARSQRIIYQGKPAIELIFVDITDRKLTEQAIRHRLEFEETVSKISSSFVGVADIDNAINTSLADMGRLSGASRAYVFQFRENGAIMDNTHEWCADDVSPQINNLRNLSTDRFPWWMKRLREGGVIHVEDAQKMPAEAWAEQKILLLDQDIKSLLVLPFNIRGELAGFIGFDNVIGAGPRRDSDLTLLKVSSKIIGDALERRWAEDELRRYSEHLQEMVEQRSSELLESEERFRTIYDNARDGIHLVSVEDKKFHDGNRAFCEMLGYSREELRNIGVMDIHPKESLPQILEQFERAAKKEVNIVRDLPVKRKDGNIFYVDVNASPTILDGKTYLVAVFRDVTERKRMEQRLLQSQRMVAIGEAAAMVGHDLRNPLQVMVNKLYLADGAVKKLAFPYSEVAMKLGLEDLFKVLGEQMEYMNGIVSNLQDYARPIRPEPVETSLTQLLDDTFSTITVPQTVKVSRMIDKNFPKLMIDPAMMRRVFTNLVMNAIQAMPKGGELTIETSQTVDTALISIRDTGVGIPQENLNKIFTPLFTTKSKGAGFGLPVCKRLVEAHDGAITVESKVGEGSIFAVRLPLRKR